MKIENNGKWFYVPDDIGNDMTKTVAEVFSSATPWDEYELNTKITELENEISELENQPDEVLVPNEEKLRIPSLEEELKELRK